MSGLFLQEAPGLHKTPMVLGGYERFMGDSASSFCNKCTQFPSYLITLKGLVFGKVWKKFNELLILMGAGGSYLT